MRSFDHIDHAFLLRTIGRVPGRELIKQWLKAGYLEGGIWHATKAGTPQGGVISPLLANIALHGMEQALGVTRSRRGWITSSRTVVRYADDFVVLCRTREDAHESVDRLTAWLAERGLCLSQDKTRIVHLTEGFDFLGFTIRRYPASNRRRGQILLTIPSKDAVATMRKKLKDAWLDLRGHSVAEVIQRLNPIIRGQANYYRIGDASKTFHDLDHWMFEREVRYVKNAHPTKNWSWRKARYWGKFYLERNDHWVFGDKQTGIALLKFSWLRIQRHTLVRGTASPDDPALAEYWRRREQAKIRTLPTQRRRIAQRQGSVCSVCGQSLFNGEDLQIHHLVPRKDGGRDDEENLALRHLYCHQQLHNHGDA